MPFLYKVLINAIVHGDMPLIVNGNEKVVISGDPAAVGHEFEDV